MSLDLGAIRPTIDFFLYEWLDVETLLDRPRYAEHSRETFGPVLDLSPQIAAERFEPFNRLVGTEEPLYDGQRVLLPSATEAACSAYDMAGSTQTSSTANSRPPAISSARNCQW